MSIDRLIAENASLRNQSIALKHLLQRYVEMYPAFDSRPIGAPGSNARILQKSQIDLEEDAKREIANARDPEVEAIMRELSK